MFISPVAPEDMLPVAREAWDSSSAGAKRFVETVAHAPEHAERLLPYYNELRFNTIIGPKTSELLRLAIAQTTQCPICLAGRREEAFAEGLTEEQIAAIVAPDEESFTAAELAVVSYGTKFGADHFAIGEADFVELRRHFTEEELMEICLLSAQFLGFGRMVMVLGLENPVCPIPAPPTGLVAPAEA